MTVVGVDWVGELELTGVRKLELTRVREVQLTRVGEVQLTGVGEVQLTGATVSAVLAPLTPAVTTNGR